LKPDSGRADRPVYLLVEDEKVSLKDARAVWGMDTFTAQQILMKEHPRSSVLVIGPAGENRCRVAILLNETGSAAGQGGYGALMGSKYLKAVVVKG